jgi:hypothetical protein
MKGLMWILLIGGSWVFLATLFMLTWEVLYEMSQM